VGLYHRAMERIPVLTDTFASPSEIAALESALADLGYEADVEPIVPPQGLGPWLVVIAFPAAQFVAGFAGKAGEDAWEAFKKFFERVRDSREPKRRFWERRREPRTGEIVIKPDVATPADMDPDQRAAVMMGWIGGVQEGTAVKLPSDLSDEAFKALFDLDFDEFPNHWVFWNPESRKWEGHPKDPPPGNSVDR
jgi:hypothetical protein